MPYQLKGPIQTPPIWITKQLEPERRLLIALLERALLDWWGFHRAKARGAKGYESGTVANDLEELKEWFEDDECEAWSFRWVCAQAFKDEEFAVKKIRAVIKNTTPEK